MMWILFMMFSAMKRWRKRETDRGCKVVLDPWSSRPVGETLAVVGGAGGNGFFLLFAFRETYHLRTKMSFN